MKEGVLLTSIVVYLVSCVIPWKILQAVISVLCIIIIATQFYQTKPFAKGISLFFLGFGIIMLWESNVSWGSYLLSFGKMLNLLSMFALLPLLAIPIELGNYAVRIQKWIFNHIRHSGLLYIVTSFLSYILSSFMNLATLPMMYYSIRPSIDLFPISQKERFMSRAITHGFSMPLIWTPMAPIVGIVVALTAVKWADILPMLLGISLIGLVTDWIIGIWVAHQKKKKSAFLSDPGLETSLAETATALEEQVSNVRSCHPIHILAAILIFNFLITLLEAKTSYDFLFLVSVIVLPFSFIWSLLIGRRKVFIEKSKRMMSSHLAKLREQFVIFLSAGFFLTALNSSGVSHALNLWIIEGTKWIGISVFLVLIPLIPLGLAFIGLHPAVGLAIVAESLKPELLGISSEIIAIAMLTGAAAAFLMGPYNATIGVMSNIVGESPYRVSNWNTPYTVIYLFIVMVILWFTQG